MPAEDFERHLFVGRQEEINCALALLESDRPVWLLHFYGDGGIGKTRLLEALPAALADRGCFVPDLVDLYDFANQTRMGLLNTLWHRLGQQHFPRFSELQTQQSPLEGANPNIGGLFEAFIADYTEHFDADARIVLRFDTLENIRDHEFRGWFLKELLPALRPRAIVFTAGREPIPEEYLHEDIEQYALLGLGEDDAVEYARQRFAEQGLTYDIKPEIFQQIHRLARGRPILLALAIDWILYNAVPEMLTQIEPDVFERKMVAWVRELPTTENRAILYMSVIYKGVTAELLAKLLKISSVEARGTLSYLRQFAFIKYRPDAQEYTLHDEMRYLVSEHAGYPPATRRKIAAQAADFYKEKIADAALRGDWLEQRSLELERLHYSLNSDNAIGEALQEALALFDPQARSREFDFCWQILEALKAQLSRFDARQFAQLETMRARLYSHQPDYLPALEILDTLLRQPLDLIEHVLSEMNNICERIIEKGDSDPVALALAQRISELLASVKAGDLENRIGVLAAQALAQENWALLDSLVKAGNFDRRSLRNLAQDLRNKAVQKRLFGAYDEARALNERSLEIEQNLPNREGMAACLNNIANLDRLQGDYARARNNARDALELRRKLKIPNVERLVGLSFSTIGLIERDAGNIDKAVELFKQALQQFEQANDEERRAAALANLGSTYYWRELRRSEIIPPEGTDEPGPSLDDSLIHLEPEHYLRKDWQDHFAAFRYDRGDLSQRADESRAYLEESLRIFEQGGNRNDLADTLNHKGRLLVHLSEWYDAEEAFTKSLELARNAGLKPLEVNNLVSLILVHYLKQTSDEGVELQQQINQIVGEAQQWYAEMLYRLELILGNIAFQETWDPTTAAYQDAFDHYIEACAQALLFSRSSFESAKYVLRDRLQRTQPEFIPAICDRLMDFWHTNKRDLYKIDMSLLDIVRNMRLRKLLEAKGGDNL